MSKVELAYEIAKKYHSGQVDKAGKDYIHHPIAVSQKLKDDDEKILALLHDTLEDTTLTLDELKRHRFKKEILDALIVITKKEDEDYYAYINRVKDNPLARKVKIADLLHNLDLSRLSEITHEDIERFKKYLTALEILILAS